MKKVKNIFLCLLITSVTAQASVNLNKSDVDGKYKQELMNRRAGLTSKSVNKRITRANILMAKSDYKKAVDILKGITESKKRPFEMAKAWQTLAYAYAQNEQYPEARNAFSKVLEIDALPYGPTMQSLFALAQLQMMDEKYDVALTTIQKYFVLAQEIKPAVYVFRASIFSEKGKKDLALKDVLKAIDMIKAPEKPKENWLVFAVSLLYSKDRFKEASEYLYKLVEINTGKKAYWSQLAGSLLNMDKEKHALAVLELALMMDLLDQEGEIKNIVSLYIQNSMPFEASELMKLAFKKGKIKKDKKSLELYANTLVQAKEYDKAMAPLGEAAKLSNKGDLYALQARIYLEKENFIKAITLFDKAIGKGLGKKELGQVYLEKAISLIQISKFEEASKLLDQVSEFKEHKDSALNWKNYIASLR